MNRNLLFIVLFLIASTASGLHAADDVPTLERVDIPADQPQSWPDFWRDHIAVPRSEFERVWQATRPRPASLPAASVESMNYSATLLGTELVDGRGHLKVHRLDGSAKWMTLSPWNLAVSSMSWSNRGDPALYGVGPDQQFWLALDRTTADLDFTWAKTGIPIGQRTVFELQLPKAQSSQMILRLPADQILSCVQVPVRQRPSAEATTGWVEWEVLAGSETQFTLVTERAHTVPSTPIISYRRQMVAALREDHLRFEATFQVEVLNGEIRELELTTPAAAHVYAITWGTDLPLDWKRVSTSTPRDTLRIRFPDAQSGPLRTIRVEGIVSQRPGASISLPQIDFPQGVFRSGEIQISVTRPLMLTTLRSTGCRPQSAVLTTSEGETHSFLQTTSLAQLILEVRRPRSLLTAQVLSTVSLTPDDWIWNSEIEWSSASGTAFQLAVRLPAEWDVTDVGLLGENGIIQPMNWDLSKEADGRWRVAMELLEAVTPDRARRIQISARHTSPASISQFLCPVIEPQDCQSVSTLIQIDGGHQHDIFPSPIASWSSWSQEQLPAAWQQHLKTSALRSSSKTALWYEVDPLNPEMLLTIYPKPEPITAQAELSVETKEGLLTETINLHVRPVGPDPLTRLLVWISEPGADIAWKVRHPENLSLISTQLPLTHNLQTGMTESGELWELRLPETDASELQLQGVRTRSLSLPMSVGLVFLPQAEMQSSSVAIQSSESQGVQLSARNMIEQVADSQGLEASTSQPRRTDSWTYQAQDAQLTLVSRRNSLQEPPCLARLHLRSLLTAFQSGSDLHLATITLSENRKSLQFKLPENCEWESADIAGESLELSKENTFFIPPVKSHQTRELKIRYRERRPVGFLSEQRAVAIPMSDDVVWTETEWEFYLPPAATIVREPDGLRLTSALPAPSWYDRFFGPIGRTRTPLFIPWNPQSWMLLTGQSRPAISSDANAITEFETPLHWQKLTAFSCLPKPQWTLETWHRGRLKVLSWLALLFTLTIIIAIRQLGWTMRTRFACVWLAVWSGLAVTISPPWVEIVGGIIAGSLVSWLIPRHWLKWRVAKSATDPVVPVGSTQSFLLPKVSAISTLMFVFVIWGVSALAAPLPAIPMNGEHILLVPVDPDGQPARKLPLIYMHPETWDTLRGMAEKSQPSSPDWLIQSVKIQGQIGLSQLVSFQLQADVLVLGQEGNVTLPMPTRLIQASTTPTCRIDGLPATIAPATRGDGYAVSWLRSPPAISALHESVATSHTLTLEWQQSWQQESLQNAVEFSLLPAAATGMSLSRSSVRNSETSAANGQPNELAHRWGGVAQPEITLAWPADSPAGSAAEIQLDLTETCDLSGELLDCRSRMVIRPRSGTLQHLQVQFPANAVLRRWSSDVTADFRMQDTEGQPGIGWLRLESPTIEDVVLEFDYVIPIKSLQQEMNWSGVTGLSSSAVKIGNVQRWLSIFSPIDYKVQLVAVDVAGLIQLDYSQSRDLFKGLVLDRTPQATFQILQKTPIRLQFVPNQSSRKLLLWQQTGTLQGDRLKWEIEGELEATGVPIYIHQLLIDRRLTIENVSVRERGTERLLRRSETRSSGNSSTNRMTLYLSDAVTETQKITISGSMPFNPEATLTLPNVRCEEADLSGGRVVLHSLDNQDIHWLSARGLRELSTNREAAVANEKTWIFDQLDADWRATIRLSSSSDRQPTRVAHVFSSEDAQSLQCLSLWRIPMMHLKGAAAILVPAPWEVASESSMTGGNFNVTRSPQGEWNIVLTGDPAATEAFVKLRLRIQRGALKSHQILLPRPFGDIADDTEIWVAEHTRLPQLSFLQMDANNPREPGPEDWLQGGWQMPAPMETDRIRWLKTNLDSVSLMPPGSHTTRSVNMPWVEHILWQMTPNQIRGFTRVQMSDAQLAMTAQVPNEIQLRAVVIDHQPAETRVEVEGQVQMSATDGQPFRSLCLIWDQTTSQQNSPFGAWEIIWPTWPQAHVQQQAVCVIPDRTKLIRGRGDWVAGDWIDRMLLRLETQGDALPKETSSDDYPAVARQYRELYDAAVSQLQMEHEAFERASRQRHSRWQAIVERINHLNLANSKLESGITGFDVQFPSALLARHDLLYGMVPANSSSARWWLIDRSWLSGLFGLAVTVVLWPLLLLLLKPGLIEWWHNRPDLSAAVLGLIWWICLVPSILGFAILSLGLYRSAWPRSPAQPTKTGSTASAPIPSA